MPEPRTRYAIVGAGARAGMFVHAATQTYAEHAELVALCDPSAVRMAFWNGFRERWGGGPVAAYAPADFDRLVAEQRPDVVVVCSVDATHDRYIVRALELGCDVVTEKPMTTDAAKARAILDAVERTGGRVRVAFNYRWAPEFTRLRELIAAGEIGRPRLVDFQWTLDTNHGADYFRRWHREKDQSGGLLVHKASHHFDLVNFWLDSVPERVVAMGGLRFYGRANAEARGETVAYERYTGVAEAADDPFRLTLDDNAGLRGLYLEAEAETGYLRDRNVFGDGITIEDTLGVLAHYRDGTQLNYSLVAYSPWEGLRVCITGTRGRAELFVAHAGGVEMLTAARTLYLYPMFGEPREVPVPEAEGGHGGGDARIVQQIFDPEPPADPFGRSADHRDGAAALALGLAANESLARGGTPVEVADLLPL